MKLNLAGEMISEVHSDCLFYGVRSKSYRNE